MRLTLQTWLNANLVIVSNATSLIGTTAITSGLGFIYWWLAARTFPSAEVGLASAAISAMTLLGTVGILGLGTFLIGELPRKVNASGSLIATSLVVAGMAAGALGILFALFAPHLSSDLELLGNGLANVTIFAVGVALTSSTMVLDQAFIGLFRGDIQLWRNVIFAVSKLILLWFFSEWLAQETGMAIYLTWAIGNLCSLFVLVGLLFSKGIHWGTYRPQWQLLRSFGRGALEHHALNLALLAPGLLLPIIVTVFLSTNLNASFYAAWMIVSFVFAVPSALTTVLYAVSSTDPVLMAHKIRITLKLSYGIGLSASGVVFVGAYLILGLFGKSYALQADWTLRILALGVFPVIIKAHYVAISRVHGRIWNAAKLMVAGGLLEIVLAAVGASIAGLLGLSVGWVIALFIEAALMVPIVYKAIAPAQS